MFFKQFVGVEVPTDLKTGLHQTGRSNHHPLIYFLKVYFMVYRNKQSQCVQLRVFVQDPCPSSHGIALHCSITCKKKNNHVHMQGRMPARMHAH